MPQIEVFPKFVFAMGTFPRNIQLFFLLPLIYFVGACSDGDKSADVVKCEEVGLGIYVDSLNSLLLAYQPTQIIQISDSLNQKYDDLECSEMLKIKSTQAYAYELLYNYEAALEIYNKSLKIAVKNQFIEEEISIRLALARVYEVISRPELCVENLERAKVLMDENGFVHELARYYVRYASYVRVYDGNTELAREYATEALVLAEKYGNIESVVGGNLVLGIVTDDFDKSIGYTQLAIDNFYELGDSIGGMFQELNLARRYLRKGNNAKTLKILDRVEAYAGTITNNDKIYNQLQMSVAKIRATVFENTDDKERLIAALKNYNKYSQLFGVFVNQDQINQLVIENAIREETDKIEIAEKQNRLLIIVLLCLSGVIILLGRLYWLNRKGKNKIEEQKTTITRQFDELEQLYNYKTTLLSEVHHRIKNNLQLIISLLTLQKAKLGKDFDQKILDTFGYRINSISRIHEQLYNLQEFDQLDVKLYLSDLLENFQGLIQERNIRIDQNVESVQLNIETVTPLGLIWSELISNSIKYNPMSKAIKISFSFGKEGEFYTMHYSDNGKGYPNGIFNANELGMGFTIINSLARQLSAETKAYNSNGAHFTMHFKEKLISPL